MRGTNYEILHDHSLCVCIREEASVSNGYYFCIYVVSLGPWVTLSALRLVNLFEDVPGFTQLLQPNSMIALQIRLRSLSVLFIVHFSLYHVIV
jgi:hypothetical protein